MEIKPIRNEADYKNALERLEVIFDAKRGTKEGDELEILSILIDHYERENFPIGMPDPISAINFRMEQMGLKQKEKNKTESIFLRSSLDNHQNKLIKTLQIEVAKDTSNKHAINQLLKQ